MQLIGLVKVEINQDMFDALVSFTFNLGAGNLQSSTLLKLLNQSKYSEASGQFTRWVFAGSQKLDGLVRRRKAEQKLFRSKVLSHRLSSYDLNINVIV